MAEVTHLQQEANRTDLERQTRCCPRGEVQRASQKGRTESCGTAATTCHPGEEEEEAWKRSGTSSEDGPRRSSEEHRHASPQRIRKKREMRKPDKSNSCLCKTTAAKDRESGEQKRGQCQRTFTTHLLRHKQEEIKEGEQTLQTHAGGRQLDRGIRNQRESHVTHEHGCR